MIKLSIRSFPSAHLILSRSKSSTAPRKFESFKEKYELNSKLLHGAFIVICLDGVNFKKLCQINSFNKPVDQRNVNLMNSTALKLFKNFESNILCAYGFSDEFSFVLKPDSDLFKRNSK